MIDQIGNILKDINAPIKFESIKLIRLGNYISLVNQNCIQECAEKLRQEETLKYCTIGCGVLLILEYLNKLKPRTQSLYIPDLGRELQKQLALKLPNFFNEIFWFASAKLILNYLEAWKLDKEFMKESPPVICSPLGCLNPTQIETKEQAEAFTIGIAAYVGMKEITVELDLANSSVEVLEKLLGLP